MPFIQSDCKHAQYDSKVTMDMVKMKEIGATQMVMKIECRCHQCGLPFVFHAPHGFSTTHPTQNNDGTELRVPMDYPEQLSIPVQALKTFH